MRWRAFHFLNPNPTKSRKETFGLNTTEAPPPIKELKSFQDGLANIAKNLKFRRINNNFQKQLKDDLKVMKSQNKISEQIPCVFSYL